MATPTVLGEQLGEPGLPGALGLVLVGVVGEEVVAHADHAVPADEPVQGVAGAHPQEARVEDGVDDPLDRSGPL